VVSIQEAVDVRWFSLPLDLMGFCQQRTELLGGEMLLEQREKLLFLFLEVGVEQRQQCVQRIPLLSRAEA
jgi:hypothetical protein